MSDSESDGEVEGFQFNAATGVRESTTYASHKERRWVECYELIQAKLFPEAKKAYIDLVTYDGIDADTDNFRDKIKAGIAEVRCLNHMHNSLDLSNLSSDQPCMACVRTNLRAEQSWKSEPSLTLFAAR